MVSLPDLYRYVMNASAAATTAVPGAGPGAYKPWDNLPVNSVNVLQIYKYVCVCVRVCVYVCVCVCHRYNPFVSLCQGSFCPEQHTENTIQAKNTTGAFQNFEVVWRKFPGLNFCGEKQLVFLKRTARFRCFRSS